MNTWSQSQFDYMEMMGKRTILPGRIECTPRQFVNTVILGFEAATCGAAFANTVGLSFDLCAFIEFVRLREHIERGLIEWYRFDCDGNGVIQKLSFLLNENHLGREIDPEGVSLGQYEMMTFFSMASNMGYFKSDEAEKYLEVMEKGPIETDYIVHGRNIAAILDDDNVQLIITRLGG